MYTKNGEKTMEHIIDVADGIDVSVSDMKVSVKGPKGDVERDFDDPRFNHLIEIEKKENKVVIKFDDEKRKVKAFAGSVVAHIRNMMTGVTKGYKYELKIIFTHFPIMITTAGGEVHIKNFLGEKGARIAKIVRGAEVHVDKEHVEVKGIDIEAVGQTSVNIEKICDIKGRDRRIFQDGIYISGRFLQTGEKI